MLLFRPFDQTKVLELWRRHDNFIYGRPHHDATTEIFDPEGDDFLLQSVQDQEEDEFILQSVQDQENGDEYFDLDMLQDLEEDGIILHSVLDYENNL